VVGGYVGTERRRWLGHACRFLNDEVVNLDRMAPHNELAPDGGYCLAAPGREYLVYVPATGDQQLVLAVAEGSEPVAVQVLEPATGEVRRVTATRQGQQLLAPLPFEADQVVHLLCGR
jgi:hypothetical protein